MKTPDEWLDKRQSDTDLIVKLFNAEKSIYLEVRDKGKRWGFCPRGMSGLLIHEDQSLDNLRSMIEEDRYEFSIVNPSLRK